MNYTDSEIEKLLTGIFNGRITEMKLPKGLYNAIGEYLEKGLFKGFGSTIETVTAKNLPLLAQLRENVYMFSAAKTYQEVKDISSLLVTGDEVRTKQEFMKLGRERYDTWNKAWGEAEYNTAIGQGQNAAKWKDIIENADVLPWLRYSAIGDACVICRPLDGFTARYDDKVWAKIYPLNHFNCFCIVEQDNVGERTKMKDPGANIPDVFDNNPGMTGSVFTKDHPYFKEVPKALAKRNFDLPL